MARRSAPTQVHVVCKGVKKQCRAGLPSSERLLVWTKRIAELSSTGELEYRSALQSVFGVDTTSSSESSPSAATTKVMNITGSGAGAGAGAGAGSTAPGSATVASTASMWAEHVYRVPSLGATPSQFEAWVGAAQKQQLRRVLCLFAQVHSIQFCPSAVAFASAALYAGATEAEAFGFLGYLLKRDGTSLPAHPHVSKSLAAVARLLVEQRSKAVAKAIHQAGAAAAVENVLHRWLDSLFVGWLKPDLLLRAMDGFMNEGPKVLLRLCVAITKSFESAIVKCNTADEALDSNVFKLAFGLRRFRRDWVNETLSRFQAALKARGNSPVVLPPLWYHPKVSPPSTIANPKALSWLFDHLTLEAHTSDWKQLYSTDVHGWGLDRLYEQTRLESPSIVLIHASPQRSADSDAADAAAAVDYRENESVFGFYTDVVLRPLKATGRVATTRLFQLFPEDARRSYAVQADAAQRVVGVMCSPEFLACGGSSTSAVAIRLHKGLTNGTTSASNIFRSPAFVKASDDTTEVPFRVHAVEVYTLVGERPV